MHHIIRYVWAGPTSTGQIWYRNAFHTRTEAKIILGVSGTRADRDLLHENLPLARAIALGYGNVPGCTPKEIAAEAERALARAAESYEATKGPFEPYARRVIQNALKDLFRAQRRYVEKHVFSIDAPPPDGPEGPGAQAEWPDPLTDVARAVRENQSSLILREATGALPDKARWLVERIRDGLGFADLGRELGVSRQAAHKAASQALGLLREELEKRGFGGLDSQGFLRSASRRRGPVDGGGRQP